MTHYEKQSMKELRAGMGEGLVEAGKRNENVVALSADVKVGQLAHKVDQMDAHIDELMHEQRDINREQTETNNEVALQIEAINNALDQLREKPAQKRNKIGYKKIEE